VVTVVLDDMDHLEPTVEGVPGFRNDRPGDVMQALLTTALQAASEQKPTAASFSAVA
jgi:hypothetical protein